MGYEVKLFVVDVTNYIDKKLKKNFGRIIAQIDLSSVSLPDQFFKKEADCCIYANGGDIPVCRDKYGYPLKACTDLPSLIAWMKEEEKREHYRRLPLAVGLLENIDQEEWGNIQVISYGH